jgi:hypothetical protein
MVDSVEEQEKEQTELELTQHSPTRKQIAERLVNGLKWSDKEYGKAFKRG